MRVNTELKTSVEMQTEEDEKSGEVGWIKGENSSESKDDELNQLSLSFL